MSQPSKVDQFYKLKYMGYCLSQMAPDGIASNFTDYVNYAKFHLSLDKHVLMEDPIWDLYTDEQLLVEFFANVFAKNDKKRQEFEATFKGKLAPVDEFNDWADRQIAKNKIELEEKAAKLEDSVRFTPDTLGE